MQGRRHHLYTALSVLAAAAISWFGISRGFQEPDAGLRGALLAAPGVAFGLLVLPELARRWWLRVALASAIWGLALYGAIQLYYVAGGGGPACAITGFWASAALVGISLWTRPKSLSRHRLLLVAAGVLWVLGSAAIGHGVDLNLDLPLKRPRPGRWFLLAGVVAWYAPYAVLRGFRAPAESEVEPA